MAHTPENLCKMILMLLMVIGSSVAADDKFPDSKPVDPAVMAERAKDFTGKNLSFYLYGPSEYCLLKQYQIVGRVFFNFKPKSDDVFLASFARSGHDWVSQLMWLLVNKINVTEAKAKPLIERVPLLEYPKSLNMSKMDLSSITALPKDLASGYLSSYPSPRVIRTQLPLSLVPKIASSSNKIVYLVRNPKDIVIAGHRYVSASDVFKFVGTVDRFFYWFEKNINLYSPYWAHLHEAFALKSKPNILFIYSDEKPESLIEKVAKFLDVKYSEDELKNLSDYLKSIEQIETNMWKDKFSPELNGKVNDWINKNIGDIKFPYTKNLLS